MASSRKIISPSFSYSPNSFRSRRLAFSSRYFFFLFRLRNSPDTGRLFFPLTRLRPQSNEKLVPGLQPPVCILFAVTHDADDGSPPIRAAFGAPSFQFTQRKSTRTIHVISAHCATLKRISLKSPIFIDQILPKSLKLKLG